MGGGIEMFGRALGKEIRQAKAWPAPRGGMIGQQMHENAEISELGRASPKQRFFREGRNRVGNRKRA
jgi:hypothetical protein